MRTLQECKDEIAIQGGYQNWYDFEESETDFSCRMAYLEDAANLFANQFKEKSDKCDALDKAIGQIYDYDDEEESGGLDAIGEIVASHLGYM